MEKAIAQSNRFNIFATVGDDTAEMAQEDEVELYQRFFDQDYCEQRTVTDVQWSPRRDEPYLLATYSQMRDATATSQDPDGLALIWSFLAPDKKAKDEEQDKEEERPEYILESQSAVMTGIFDEFSAHLIIGGTVSGQIVVWDTRQSTPSSSGAKVCQPVMKTPLNAQTHTDPVYAVTQTGAKNKAQVLISASTDGRVCHWDLSDLSQPTRSYKVAAKAKPSRSAKCLSCCKTM